MFISLSKDTGTNPYIQYSIFKKFLTHDKGSLILVEIMSTEAIIGRVQKVLTNLMIS